MRFNKMLNRTIWKIVTLFLVNISIGSQLFAQLPPLNPGWETTKRGGVAFRVGGNQEIAKYIQYDSLFQAKSIGLDSNYNFGMAMWLGNSEFNDSNYRQEIKDLQIKGHDLYDLTPNNRINYFITKFDPADYTVGDSVDHINGNKICLKFIPVILSNNKHTGNVNININVVSGSGFNQLSTNEYYLYFGAPLDTLVLIDSRISDSELTIKDFWSDGINFGSLTNVTYYSFDFKDIHMTPEALILLGKETLKLSNDYGLERPYRFIVPGIGSTPWGTPTTDIKPTLGDELGYISSQTYFDFSLMTYNEYDPIGTKRFGMTWGQFNEEDSTLTQIKGVIADGIAKHYVLLNHGHFKGNYLQNTADILQWCHDNNIPVLTSVEWSNVLYSTPQNAFVNIFPPLNVDLDGNGVPDGYSKAYSNGTLITNDGPLGSGNVSYSINNTATDSRICYISGLGGVEKGENAFEIWTRGDDVNNQITVVISATGMTTQSFTFPANTLDWTKYDLSQTVNNNNSLNIPITVSKVNISIYANITSGEVRIGGMSLKKHDPTPVELTSFSVNETNLGVELDWKTATEVNNYGFEIERASSPLGTSLVDGVSQWETIGFVDGHGNSYSPKEYSFIDTSSINGEINYRLKQIDTDGTFEYSDVVTINFSITSVNPLEIAETSLDQNHPNPFNPSTIISYQLANSTNVSLKVFDIIGNEVATLVNNEKQGPGIHSVEFNKTNFNLSSGVYFYQLIAGRYIKTKKMLLLK